MVSKAQSSPAFRAATSRASLTRSSISHVLFNRLQLFGDKQRAVHEGHATPCQFLEQVQSLVVDERHLGHLDLQRVAGIEQRGADTAKLSHPAASDLPRQIDTN